VVGARIGDFPLGPSVQEDTARGASDGLSGRWGGSMCRRAGQRGKRQAR
jgi:hypothetical protein